MAGPFASRNGPVITACTFQRIYAASANTPAPTAAVATTMPAMSSAVTVSRSSAVPPVAASAAALASLRAQLDGCDKSKLAGMLEALLAGHPVLAPEVRQMLEPDGDADDGAGTGAVADDGAVADAGGAKAGVGADAD